MSQPRKERRRTTWRRLHPSPIAVTLDGSVMASVGLYDGIHDAESAVRAAMDRGGRVFVGVELRAEEIAELKKWLDDAAFEGLAFILGARPRGRHRKVKVVAARGTTPSSSAVVRAGEVPRRPEARRERRSERGRRSRDASGSES